MIVFILLYVSLCVMSLKFSLSVFLIDFLKVIRIKSKIISYGYYRIKITKNKILSVAYRIKITKNM